MLYVVTGLPGASKTLNTIKLVCEGDEFKGRAVYYNRIPGVTIDGWQELTDDQVTSWYDLPLGSVVIIDEAYRHFPPLSRSAKRPEHYERLAEIRHTGITMFVIMQAATDIDIFPRKKAVRHYHYERHFGTQLVKRVEFKCTSGAITDTDRNSNRELAEIKNIKIDPAYFGKYESAEVHTVKSNFPWRRLLFPLVALLVVIASVAYFLSTFGKSPETDVTQGETVQAPAATGSATFSPMVADQNRLSLDSYVPRVASMPWTAPIYDPVMSEVKAAPLPKACIYSKSRSKCLCVTDQGTHLDLGMTLCLRIVRQGYFDATRPPRDVDHRVADRALDVRPSASPGSERGESAHADRAPLLVIGSRDNF